MNCHPFTVPYLESLSTGELAELADSNGLDIPPGLERVFIIGELLELERAAAKPEAKDADPDAPTGEPSEYAVLPEQYGMTYVSVLIRDPLWVFAFWEVRKQAREDAQPKEYCLRIVPLEGGADAFTVTVGESDRSLYLGIPHEGGRRFRVDLCVRQGDGLALVAESRPFRLPRLVGQKPDVKPGEPRDGDAAGRDVYGNPLAELSGARCFPLVRSIDRRPQQSKGA
ncbi:MAG: DUF4912 domain-containing protein [Treponema sp.]|nr:DUF4912 domain-containing protein [Treponema sp.]